MKKYYFLFSLVVLLSGSYSLYAQIKIKVACVGNSITYGWGIVNRDSFSYPAQLQRLLGNKYEVKNFGVGGCTLLKKGDSPYWDQKEFEEVQEWIPDIVVVMLGTNDTKPYNWKYANDFGPNYAEFLNVFKKLSGRPKVWAALPVPVFKDNYDITEKVLELGISIIRKVARQEDVPVINLFKALKPYGKNFFDGVHPDKLGAHYIAEGVYRKVRHYHLKIYN